MADRDNGALWIWLLGGFRVSAGARAIGADAWRLRKSASLVKLVALAPGHALHREQIMDALWPKLSKKAASNNLRQALHAARAALYPDPEVASRVLASSEERVVLCPQGKLRVDSEAFEEAARGARRAKEPSAYEAAVDLYTGELLPEDRYEEWAEGPRAYLRGLYLSLLYELASLYEERGDSGEAEEVLGKLLAEEPTHEGAHASLMRVYALCGRRQEALSEFGRLEEMLLKKLGMEPSASVRSLREEISSGRYPPPDTSYKPGRQQQADTTTSPTSNLPSPRSSFVGREWEMVEIKRALAMTRLLTLTGTGGSGKTRLASEVARDLTGVYPEGVWFVDLAPLSEPELVPQAVAAALKIREQPGRALTDTLIENLRSKNVLLVMDNCEHLIEACAGLCDLLLDSCPNIRILATSREALNIAGELLWQVPPLSVPEVGRSLAFEELRGYESSRLFVQRAGTRIPSFALSAEEAEAVAEICRQLEGLPLAIELAAARVGTMTTGQLAKRLEDSLTPLSSGSRTASPRHTTMRATLQWSHGLLSEQEQLSFRRLSVFAGGFTLEAAEAVLSGGGIEEAEVLDLLSAVVEKSLVVAQIMSGRYARYRLLEPIRQYARERLEESGEAEAVRKRHATYFLELAEEAELELTGPDQARWMGRLGEEHGNLRAALPWSLENEPATALQLAGVLGPFWRRQGYWSEQRMWLEEALKKNGEAAPAEARAKVHRELGLLLADQQSDFELAQASLEEALRIYRRLGNRKEVANTLGALGFTALFRGEDERAEILSEESLEIVRGSGDDQSSLYALNNLALLASNRGDYERAEELWEEALAIARKVGDAFAICDLLFNMGYSALVRGDLDRARALSEEGLVDCEELKVQGVKGSLLVTLGIAATRRSDYGRAKALLSESLELHRKLGKGPFVAECLESLAGVAGSLGDFERAARLWAAADVLREEIGLPWIEAERRLHEPYLQDIRSRSDEELWARAWEEGRAMTIEEAVGYALSGEEPAPSASEELPADERAALTRREREIAELVVQGLTNRQIAKELFISERTVTTHVGRILKKLGIHSREEIAKLTSDQDQTQDSV